MFSCVFDSWYFPTTVILCVSPPPSLLAFSSEMLSRGFIVTSICSDRCAQNIKRQCAQNVVFDYYTMSFIISVHLSVCVEQRDSHCLNFHEIWYMNIFFKLCQENFQFHENLTSLTGILHEDLYTFMIVSHWILLTMRNDSPKSHRENQNTYFMFNNFLPKIVLFMR